MSTEKQRIIDEIRRTSNENGGKSLGMARFENETGISSYQWGKYWARFSDLQKEAGIEANQFNAAYDDNFMLQKLILLIRQLKKFPTIRELTISRQQDSDFPSKGAFQRFGSQSEIMDKIIIYCQNKAEFEDIIEICKSNYSGHNKKYNISTDSKNIGEVYLFKSGRYYKIGKTNDTVRRGQEIRVQLPEKLDLVHSIKTDDPSGIEAYWHKRFSSKRMQGEWFDLSASDIKAFKLWKKII